MTSVKEILAQLTGETIFVKPDAVTVSSGRSHFSETHI